jgi:hypothetical protein
MPGRTRIVVTDTCAGVPTNRRRGTPRVVEELRVRASPACAAEPFAVHFLMPWRSIDPSISVNVVRTSVRSRAGCHDVRVERRMVDLAERAR